MSNVSDELHRMAREATSEEDFATLVAAAMALEMGYPSRIMELTEELERLRDAVGQLARHRFVVLGGDGAVSSKGRVTDGDDVIHDRGW